MMRNILSVFLFICFVCTTCFATERFFSVSEVGISAKHIGLASVESASFSPAALFDNPALLGSSYSFGVSLFTTELFEEVTYRNLAIAKRFDRFTVGIGFMDSRVDDLFTTKKSLVNGVSIIETDGTYDIQFSLYKMGVKYDLKEDIQMGVALNVVENKIGDVKGSGINADIGIHYLTERFSFSTSVDNVFQHQKVAYSNDQEELFPLKATIACRGYWHYIDPMIQMSLLADYKPQYALGLLLKHPDFSLLDIFFGYKSDYYLDELHSKVTLGLGLNVFGFGFHYAYQKSDHIDTDNYSFFSVELEI